VKFKLGDCVATTAADQLMQKLDIHPISLLARHASGDDGDLGPEDKALNKAAIQTGEGRVFSSYTLPSGDKIWIITEHDRSSTCIMTPEDY